MNPKKFIPRRLRERISWQLSKMELRRLLVHDDIPSIIKATAQYRGRAVFQWIGAWQRTSEIHNLALEVQRLTPYVIIEIGTAQGGTLFIWTRSNPSAELIVSIDLPGADFGGGYDQRRERLYREFAFGRPQTSIELIRADSHSSDTLEKLKRLLGGRPIDFLWIDGDHRYQGVKTDYELYSPLVRPGGLVAFHDIVTRGNGHEVVTFWNEIKRTRPYTEFIEDPNGDMGIGLLRL